FRPGTLPREGATMRHCSQSLRAAPAAIAVTLILGSAAVARAADSFVSIPIQIHVLKGCKLGFLNETLTAAQSRERAKAVLARINEIYKSCKMEFVLPKGDDDILLDVAITGVSADAKLTKDDRKKVRDATNKALADRFG